MKPIRIKVSPSAANASLLYTGSPGSGTITLLAKAAGPIDTGVSLVSGGYTPMSSLGLGRLLILTSGGNDTGITFTLTGVDQNGQAVTENVTGASGGASASVNYYTSLSSVTFSGGSIASTLTIGTRGTTASAALGTIPLNLYQRIGSTVQVDVTGTISYTVQMTYDDCLTPANISNDVFFATPTSPTALTAQSASKYTQLPPAVCGIQLTIPTYSTGGSVILNVVNPSNSDLG